jgi:RNA polymerase sigma factor (sigma-70 family)
MSIGNSDSEDSFLQTFLRFRTRIARAIGRIVQRDDIEDIVQETFLRCYQASARTAVRHPRSFMLTTARNLALNHVDLADNRLVARVDSFDEGAVPMFRDTPTENTPEVQERFLIMCRAVRALPVQCRRAFVLKKVYGMSRKEIADYMGLSESTVQKHIAKGMVMCSEYLESQQPAAETPALGKPGGRLLRRKAR